MQSRKQVAVAVPDPRAVPTRHVRCFRKVEQIISAMVLCRWTAGSTLTALSLDPATRQDRVTERQLPRVPWLHEDAQRQCWHSGIPLAESWKSGSILAASWECDFGQSTSRGPLPPWTRWRHWPTGLAETAFSSDPLGPPS